MFTCTVEIFGLPEEITSPPKVEVSLKDGASIKDVIAVLRRKVPALEGPVIHLGKDQLVDYFGFYINGRCYTSDQEVQIKYGDHIVLLALATGG
jgi:molybdopterin converting factor small subunit